MAKPDTQVMTSEIATIKFSAGAVDGSSSDDSSEGFEINEYLGSTSKQKIDIKDHGGNTKNSASSNPFDHEDNVNVKTEYDDSKNPFHENEKNFKNPFDCEESNRPKGLNPFDEETDSQDNQFYKQKPEENDVHKRTNGENLLSTNRFNPFDADDVTDNPVFPQLTSETQSKELLDDNIWWENQITEINGQHKKNIEDGELDMSEDHFSLPEGYMSMTSVVELEQAIASCKQLVMQCVGQSDRQKEMVNRLVQLRLKLIQAKEGPEEPDPAVKQVVGHQFSRKESSSTKHYCEKCNTLIWGVLQHWYRCTACGFCVHDKCLNLITRMCARLLVEEHSQYILSICPERGLSSQNYKCNECRAPISYQAGFGEPRQCDYSGHYYCDLCHWNDQMSIPSRIVHNWDFEPRKVCRASKQFLKLMCKKPVLRIQDINPMLFSFVEELNQVKKLREEILIMKKYFLSCKLALRSKLLLLLVTRQHFVENSDMYSLQDLVDTASDLLMPELTRIHASFAQHIKTDCQICQGKGFVCELCDYKEILFPFDNHAIVCAKCSTVLHRHCFARRNQQCPKCERMNKRSISDDSENS